MDFAGLVKSIGDKVFTPLIILLIGLALLFFLLGVLKYIRAVGKGGSEQEEGRQMMFWGIIALFVMVAVWGLVTVIDNTLKLEKQAPTIRGF